MFFFQCNSQKNILEVNTDENELPQLTTLRTIQFISADADTPNLFEDSQLSNSLAVTTESPLLLGGQNIEDELEVLLKKSLEGQTILEKHTLDHTSRKVLINLVSKEILGPTPTSSHINYSGQMNLYNVGTNKSNLVQQGDPPNKYSTFIPIKPAKKRDIEFLISYYIPDEFRVFFESIPDSSNQQDQYDSESDFDNVE
ncbi:hypothetical protein WDU94_008939 [Cyamophila willieti]